VEKEVKTETRLSVVRMCEVAGFSRAGYYRFLDPEKPAPAYRPLMSGWLIQEGWLDLPIPQKKY
jgi:hypothetical protein